MNNEEYQALLNDASVSCPALVNNEEYSAQLNNKEYPALLNKGGGYPTLVNDGGSIQPC